MLNAQSDDDVTLSLVKRHMGKRNRCDSTVLAPTCAAAIARSCRPSAACAAAKLQCVAAQRGSCSTLFM